MPKDAVFTMKLDAELRDKFMAEAEAMDRPASQVMREMMREFVHKREEERQYDAWFRKEVEAGIAEANEPNAVTYSTEEVMDRVMEVLNARIAERSRDAG